MSVDRPSPGGFWIEGPAGRGLRLGDGRPRLMGVLNVTPDSFFDGGRWLDVGAAVAHGEELVAAGADVLDVGGESTRPGHRPVPAAEQIRRVEPVVAALAERVAVPLSIDTTRAEVAAAALDAGVHWVNDTTAFGDDPELAALCADRGCPVVLMHRFDPPRRAGATPAAGRGLVRAIAAFLTERLAHARARGIAAERVILDPGVGFGTRPEDNVAIHAFVDELRAPGRPLLIGASRKSFLGVLTGRDRADDRLAATAASTALLAQRGVEILRVHDVAAMRDVCAVVAAVRAAAEEPT